MIIDYFLKSKLWKWIAINIFGKFTFRVTGYPTFDMNEFFKISPLLDPNNLYAFVSRDRKAFSYKLQKLFTKAKWSHAGIIESHESHENCKILHVTSKGILYETILNLLKEVDDFAIIQLYAAKTPQVLTRINRFKILVGQDRYDFAFDLSTDSKVYCSELVYKIVRGDTGLESLAMKKPMFTPDDVYNYGKIVYEYKGKSC